MWGEEGARARPRRASAPCALGTAWGLALSGWLAEAAQTWGGGPGVGRGESKRVKWRGAPWIGGESQDWRESLMKTLGKLKPCSNCFLVVRSAVRYRPLPSPFPGLLAFIGGQVP